MSADGDPSFCHLLADIHIAVVALIGHCPC